GQPEMKATPATLTRVAVESDGFLLCRGETPAPDGLLWTRVATEGATGLLFASPKPVDGVAIIRSLAGADGMISEVSDPVRGLYRAAVFRDGRLDAVFFAGPGARDAWTIVQGLFARAVLDPADRRALLSGRSADGLADQGPTVCACFAIGLTTVRCAISAGATDVDAVGRATKAGTNCGSCRSEIRKLIAREGQLVPA
ncbi:MAG: nitrate reductase catalytic subunit, partial [Xanthobacteraceae bacterium]